MRVLVAILALIGLADIVAAIYVYTGMYDVAASAPENPVVAWAVRNAREASVKAHADDVKAPGLGDPEMVRRGARHYADDCVVCHGAPGVKPGELAEGLNPKPPDLARAVAGDPPGQIYWIVRNGIRMTAMPACSSNHTDAELWDLVAFVKALPQLSPDRYRQMAGTGKDEGEGKEQGERKDEGAQHGGAPAAAPAPRTQGEEPPASSSPSK